MDITISLTGSILGLILLLFPVTLSLAMLLKLEPGVLKQQVTVPLVRLPHMPLTGPRMKIWKPFTAYLTVYGFALCLAVYQAQALWIFAVGTAGIFLSNVIPECTRRLLRLEAASGNSQSNQGIEKRPDAVALLCYGSVDNAAMEEVWIRSLPLVVYFSIRDLPHQILYGKQLDQADLWYILCTAVIFGWMHIPRRGWLTGFRTFILGSIYSLIAVRCGLLASVIVHVSFNVSQSNTNLEAIAGSDLDAFLRRFLRLQGSLFRLQYYLGGIVTAAVIIAQIVRVVEMK